MDLKFDVVSGPCRLVDSKSFATFGRNNVVLSIPDLLKIQINFESSKTEPVGIAVKHHNDPERIVVFTVYNQPLDDRMSLLEPVYIGKAMKHGIPIYSLYFTFESITYTNVKTRKISYSLYIGEPGRE